MVVLYLNSNKIEKDKNELVYLPIKLGLMDVSKISKLGWSPKVNEKTKFKGLQMLLSNKMINS